MVISSVPGEGKSFISSNLSVAFAQNDKKVLLIDCDLRLGRLHKMFEISNKRGLSNLIANIDEESEYEKYIQKTDIKNLYIFHEEQFLLTHLNCYLLLGLITY